MNRLNIGRSSLQRLHFIGFFYICQRSEILKNKTNNLKKGAWSKVFRNLNQRGRNECRLWISINMVEYHPIILKISLKCYNQILNSISSLKKMFRKLHKIFFWDLWTKIQIFFVVTNEIDCNSRFFTATSTKILAQQIRKQFHSSSRFLFFIKKMVDRS